VELIPRFLFPFVVECLFDGLRFVGVDPTRAPVPDVEGAGVVDDRLPGMP
jgi:hypothetical protein